MCVVMRMSCDRMEVASQVRVVLEENQSLLSQHKSQQHIISDLRTQHHSRGMYDYVGDLELEGNDPNVPLLPDTDASDLP